MVSSSSWRVLMTAAFVTSMYGTTSGGIDISRTGMEGGVSKVPERWMSDNSVERDMFLIITMFSLELTTRLPLFSAAYIDAEFSALLAMLNGWA